MAKKAVFVDLEKHPDLYDAVTELAQENRTSAASIARKLIEKGLKQEGFKVSGKKIKVNKVDAEKV